MKILFIIDDKISKKRPDINKLFIKYLSRHSINTTIIENAKFFHFFSVDNFSKLLKFKKFDFIQVRNQIYFSTLILLFCKLYHKPFIYWMSFPVINASTNWINVHQNENKHLYIFFKYVKQIFAKLLFKYIILKYSHHIFVQSAEMKKEICLLGTISNKVTAVPMGIDLEEISGLNIKRLACSKNIISYLGALDRTRHLDFLLISFQKVLRVLKDPYLLLIGDSRNKADVLYLKQFSRELLIDHKIIYSGWVDRKTAFEFLSVSTIGVSPIPPLDVYIPSSPTKTIEYLAMGLPAVVTDIPDQTLIINESGAGISVPYDVDEFSKAILKILQNKFLQNRMSNSGPEYVKNNRSYAFISKKVAGQYLKLYTYLYLS